MTKWVPNLDDCVQPIPTYRMLRKAVWKLYQRNIITNPWEVLKDSYGTYGYRYPQFILVAKKGIYGNIVSVHEEAILKARMYKVGILMWLDSVKKYYWFDPEEIDRNSEKNHKGLAPMLNFDIKLAKAMEL